MACFIQIIIWDSNIRTFVVWKQTFECVFSLTLGQLTQLGPILCIIVNEPVRKSQNGTTYIIKCNVLILPLILEQLYTYMKLRILVVL